MTPAPIRAALVVAALAVAATAADHAQQVFRASTDTVLLSVSALDGRGHPVLNLQRGEFQVFEDGLPQTISIFASDPQPIALSILIDASTSMEMKLQTTANAAISLCRRLKPGDVAQIIDFDSEVRIRQPFTADEAALERAIHAIRADGSTALHTAIYVAISELAHVAPQAPGEIRRQAIVVLSDGDDTASVVSYDDVLDRAKRSGVAVYAIGLLEKPTGHSYSNAQFNLRTLSQATGGRAFFPDAVAALPEIYEQIADELGAQYVIGYISTNTKRDGTWRQVTLRTTHADTNVRTKSGYFGPKAP